MMSDQSLTNRLGVCNWSLRSETPDQMIDQLNAIGLQRIQIALDPLWQKPEVWGALPEKCQAAGVTYTSGMFGTLGEDYTSLETIRKTGGVIPDQHWDSNWKNFHKVIELAKSLGISLVSFHAGFLPHEESDPSFAKLFDRMQKISDLFGENGLQVCCETGQETAESLRYFLEKLNRPNIGVNFDPANMLLYDKGDPIAALRVLAPWLKQCHIKDARRTRNPGTWGDEVVVGTGEVDWKEFFRNLDAVGFYGDFVIEREAGEQRVEDIRTARIFVDEAFQSILPPPNP